MRKFGEIVDIPALTPAAPAKRTFKGRFKIEKSADDKMLAFGWASVAVRSTGEQIEDWQEDMIDPEDLEKAAYEFAELYREGGEMHERGGAAILIESVVFTKEKQRATKTRQTISRPRGEEKRSIPAWFSTLTSRRIRSAKAPGR